MTWINGRPDDWKNPADEDGDYHFANGYEAGASAMLAALVKEFDKLLINDCLLVMNCRVDPDKLSCAECKWQSLKQSILEEIK